MRIPAALIPLAFLPAVLAAEGNSLWHLHTFSRPLPAAQREPLLPVAEWKDKLPGAHPEVRLREGSVAELPPLKAERRDAVLSLHAQPTEDWSLETTTQGGSHPVALLAREYHRTPSEAGLVALQGEPPARRLEVHVVRLAGDSSTLWNGLTDPRVTGTDSPESLLEMLGEEGRVVRSLWLWTDAQQGHAETRTRHSFEPAQFAESKLRASFEPAGTDLNLTVTAVDLIAAENGAPIHCEFTFAGSISPSEDYTTWTRQAGEVSVSSTAPEARSPAYLLLVRLR